MNTSSCPTRSGGSDIGAASEIHPFHAEGGTGNPVQ